MLRTGAIVVPPPNSMIPAFRTRCRGIARCSAIRAPARASSPVHPIERGDENNRGRCCRDPSVHRFGGSEPASVPVYEQAADSTRVARVTGTEAARWPPARCRGWDPGCDGRAHCATPFVPLAGESEATVQRRSCARRLLGLDIAYGSGALPGVKFRPGELLKDHLAGDLRFRMNHSLRYSGKRARISARYPSVPDKCWHR